jgi:hypothetical protein
MEMVLVELSPWKDPTVIQHSQRLIQSFVHWTGRSLLPLAASPEEIAHALFEAPFVVVSHGTEADPILNYGNHKALQLWEMDWDQFTQTPSRLTAEPIAQPERDRLLAQAKAKGYIDDYQGIRISKTGRRFLIQNVVLWNVIDEQNYPYGQAATFSEWEWLPFDAC